MSRENLEMVRAIMPSGVDLVELLDGGDLSALQFDPNQVDPDFEVAFFASGADSAQGNYRGLAGIAAGWADWLEPWESYYLEPEEFIDAGEHVVVLAMVRARTHRDGVDVEHRPASVWTIRDGKLVAARFYLDRADAFKAAGLDPAQARSRGSSPLPTGRKPPL